MLTLDDHVILCFWCHFWGLQKDRDALGTTLDDLKSDMSRIKSDLRAAESRGAMQAAALASSSIALDETRAALADTSSRELVSAAKVAELTASLLTFQVRSWPQLLKMVAVIDFIFFHRGSLYPGEP